MDSTTEVKRGRTLTAALLPRCGVVGLQGVLSSARRYGDKSLGSGR